MSTAKRVCIKKADLFYFVKKPEIVVPDIEADTLHIEEQPLKDGNNLILFAILYYLNNYNKKYMSLLKRY